MPVRLMSFGGAAVCALMAVSAPVWAATPASSAADNSASGTRIEEVVVTARKIEENVQKIPVAVTAISSQTLTRSSFRSVRDLMGLAPGLNIKQDPNGQQGEIISLRGQAPPDTVLSIDPAVAIYSDNVLMPRGYGLHNAMMDVARIEVLRGPQGTLYGKNTDGGAVNVITNDPTSQLGGSIDASGGNYGSYNVMGILNLPISPDAGFRFVVDTSGNGPYGHSLNGGIGWDRATYLRGKFKGELGKLTVRAFGDYTDDTNGGALFKLAGLTPAVVNGAGVVTTPQGGSLTKEAAIELFGASNASTWPGAIAAINQYIGGNPYQSGGIFTERGRSQASSAGLDLTYALTDSLKLRSITGYRWLQFRAPEDLDATPWDGTSPTRGANDTFWSEEAQLLGGDTTFNWVAGTFLSWESGQELSTTQTLAAQSVPLGTISITNGNIGGTSWAVFGQANWRFAPRWSVTGGVRYTSETKYLVSFNGRNLEAPGAGIITSSPTTLGPLLTCAVPADLRVQGAAPSPPAPCQSNKLANTFTQPTWTASLTYDLLDDVSAYFKASHGFRGGGENYRGSTIDVSFQPFQPELANEYEIGLKSELFDHRLRVNLAAFHDDLSNVQRSVLIATLVGVNIQTTTVVTNAATAKIDGVEAEATWRVTQAFTLSGSMGLMDPRYVKFVDFTGDRTHEAWPTPKLTYDISATYVQPTPVGDLTGTLTWAGQSQQDMVPASKQAYQITQPAYGLLNGRLSLAIPQYQATVALFARNMLAQQYIVNAVGLESIGFNDVIEGEPRTFGIEVTKRFGGN